MWTAMKLIKCFVFVRGVASLICNVGHQSDCDGVGLVETMDVRNCSSSVQVKHCMIHTYTSPVGAGNCWTSVSQCIASTCAGIQMLLTAVSRASDSLTVNGFRCTTCSTDLCNVEDVERLLSATAASGSSSRSFVWCLLLGGVVFFFSGAV
uniref:UPAR/Ly6 domain-containing protein n=1 Tax=Noctiluca scintillans TaxID=2966 RepID=A0A7S1AZQ4_NOCSC|mmetsp:Transcript_7162/g.19630  ORF Transcript_7162/g.19630 Transcript_7162/m.19630 type:complete len:151 (+) Transcript_7162:101-553(+)